MEPGLKIEYHQLKTGENSFNFKENYLFLCKSINMKIKNTYIFVIAIFYILIAFMSSCNKDKNMPPHCSITKPQNGIEILANSTIDISANAKDPDGKIDIVQFYINDTIIKDFNEPAYDYNWRVPEIETTVLSLKIIAFDNKNSSSEDEIVLFLIGENFNNGTIDSIEDFDGNLYKTIKIGKQWWMAENLRVKHYNNGDVIPLIKSKTNWDTLGYKSAAMCFYNNIESNSNVYGALYTWSAAMNRTDNNSGKNVKGQGICPEGWRLPDDNDWKLLELHLGMSQNDVNNYGIRGTNQGSKIADNAGLWQTGFLSDNEEFGKAGFRALPGGYRSNYGNFFSLSFFTGFWSYSEKSDCEALIRTIDYSFSNIGRNPAKKNFGYSIRCIKDN